MASYNSPAVKGFEPFSVLLPVYHGDRAKWLDQAIGSALDDQQLRPDQIVVVQDGPVGPKLAAVLDQWAARPEVDHLQLATNQGISAALNAGLKVCRHSIVARCDADDVNLPERFSTQIPMLQAGLDLVGGAMVEFTDQARQAGIGRNYPTGQAEISQFARLHNPFAHPTVVFRRQLVEQAGGYPRLDRLEDYLLWVRLLRRGARVANTDQVVVAYRVSQAAYARRGGAKLVLAEVTLQRTFRAMGFTTRRQAWRNLVLRAGFELAPVRLRQWPLRRMLSRGVQ